MNVDLKRQIEKELNDLESNQDSILQFEEIYAMTNHAEAKTCKNCLRFDDTSPDSKDFIVITKVSKNWSQDQKIKFKINFVFVFNDELTLVENCELNHKGDISSITNVDKIPLDM